MNLAKLFLGNTKTGLLLKINCRLFSNSAEDDLKIEYLRQSFSQYNRPNHYEKLLAENKNISKTRRSAVLVPISIRLEKNSNGNYIQKSFYTLSKRTELMNSFKGEICFVGGRRDQEDSDDVETALREAKEEIGIDKSQITILAQLCPILTSNGNLITPVIAYFDKSTYVPNLNQNEVEYIFDLPTERFLFKQGHKSKEIRNKTDEFLVHYFEDKVNEKLITTWGATALMSIVISSILHSRIPAFEVDTQMPLTNENLADFLENYLLRKSAKVLEYIAKK